MPVETVPNSARQNNEVPLHSLSTPVGEPLLASLIRQIKETIHPEKLPPLQVSFQPAKVKSIWGDYEENKKKSRLTSLIIHCIVVGLLAIPVGNKIVQTMKRPESISINLSDYQMPASAKKAGGGGGGGDRSPQPAPKADLPKFKMDIQKAPPEVVIKNPEPKLPVQPTVVAPPELALNASVNLGDLNGLSALSNGTGSRGGIGSGEGGGVGSGRGGGVGPGEGGGIGGGVFRVGGGVSAPQLVSKIEPEYSEAARKAKYQGTVTLKLIVQKDGTVRDISIITPLGLGLDEKAIEAVKQWRFRPGMKAGQAVDVIATVEVTFRLL